MGLIGRTVTANVFVRNFRNVTWISGAYVNCSFESTPVTNITDMLNGTYSINFTAPLQEGDYIVTCDAAINNNTGSGYDNFTTEVATLTFFVSSQPNATTLQSITLYYNQSFSTQVNASSMSNGTAYNSNISVVLLPGWSSNTTVYQCGDVAKKSYCTRSFLITAPAGTSPGNYYINASMNWTNPDGSLGYNISTINVSVSSNPILNVTESYLSEVAGDGANARLYNMTVQSIGNDNLQNINFSCYSGTVCTDFALNFTPSNITSIPTGSNYSVAVNVTVPIGYAVGNYSGMVQRDHTAA